MTVNVETTSAGVCVITLDRPEAKHALTVEMRDLITDALRAGRADPAVRSFLITSTGDAFCAGMDLGASTVVAGRPAGLRSAHDRGGVAGRRAGVHP